MSNAKPYAPLLYATIERMPQSLRHRARRDVEALVARAPSTGDLRALAADPAGDPALRARAVWATGLISKQKARPLLLSILEESNADEMLLWETGKALVQAGGTRVAVPHLTRMLRSGSVAQRTMAAWTLGMGSTSSAARLALEQALRDPSEHADVRAHAAEGLGNMMRKASVKVLIAALQDPEPKVRFWSAYALGQIGDRRALPALQQLAHDETSIEGFGTIGSETRAVIAKLKESAPEE